MGTEESYSTMEREELQTRMARSYAELEAISQEIRKLKKKFKSGRYDRQVICEHIISLQPRTAYLIETIEGIKRALDQSLAPASS